MTAETQKAYSAEYALRDQLELTQVTLCGTTVVIPVERRFAELVDVQRYVDLVLALNWVRAAYPAAAQPLRVVRHKVINEAKCGNGTMWVNPDHDRFAMRETVILHELAHHLAGGWAAHGPMWRACFVHLLEELVGPEVAWLMRVNYDDAGLKVPMYTDA